MAVKNIYGEKKKEKNLYGASGTATPRTQGVTQSNGNGWSEGQSTARMQSSSQSNGWNTRQSAVHMQSAPQREAVPKPKREKSPSELGEEVVRIMLEDFKEEERQKQAAFDRAARYNGGAAKAKATAGNRKTAQYGNAAGQFEGASSYSSPATAKPATGNKKATLYGGAAAAQYNAGPAAQTAAVPKAASYAAPSAAKPMVRRREKTPSELGDEVVARVLVEEGLMDPKDLEEYLASFEEPVEEPSARTFTTGVGRSDIIGPEAYAAQNTTSGDGLSVEAGAAGEDTDPTQDIPEWLALMLKQDPPYLGLTESAIRVGSELKDKIEQLTPDLVNQLALDWLPLLSTPDLYDPGLVTAANQAGPWLWDQTKQLWDDTHIAEGASVPLYLIEKGLSGAATGLESAYNGMIDLAWAGVNADLEQQKQQAQQFSFLGGPYQTYADQIADNARSIQEALPEAAEKLRIHTATESEALPNEKNNGTLSKEQDSKQQDQKEWWEKPGASEPIDPNDPAYQAKNAELTDNQRKAGLSIVKINGEYYVDVTIMIDTRLQEVEQDFRNHFIDFQNSSSHNEEFMLANIAWFISQVKGNGPWDIKIADSWERQFGDVLKLDDMSETFAYNGQVVTPENLGNLTYGYLGRSMGWPAETLYLAGGIYNQFNLAAKKIVESEKTPTKEGRMDPALFYWYNVLKPSVYSDGSYGDGENDYEYVKKGVELYEAVH